MDLVQRADEFAEMHFVEIDHRRKYTNEPYMVHPREVAELVRVSPYCLRVADREVWGSPEDLEELVEDLQEAVDRARELARKGVR